MVIATRGSRLKDDMAGPTFAPASAALLTSVEHCAKLWLMEFEEHICPTAWITNQDQTLSLSRELGRQAQHTARTILRIYLVVVTLIRGLKRSTDSKKSS